MADALLPIRKRSAARRRKRNQLSCGDNHCRRARRSGHHAVGSRMSTAHANGKAAFSMNAAARLQYYRRILPAYLGSGRSQLSFWHETPAINSQARNGTEAFNRQLGPYYMSFREKADYAGPYDAAGVPMLDYRGAIGLQYNPIEIAQWGL